MDGSCFLETFITHLLMFIVLLTIYTMFIPSSFKVDIAAYYFRLMKVFFKCL